jgi:hypothetical protein
MGVLMSKKCIVNRYGVITDICEDGEEFPIYEGDDAKMVWMDIPDDFAYDEQKSRVRNGDFINLSDLETPFSLGIARKGGYGPIEEQLDMQYRDKLNSTTEWEDHVTAVKTAVKKPSLAVNTDADVEAQAEFREEPHFKKI